MTHNIPLTSDLSPKFPTTSSSKVQNKYRSATPKNGIPCPQVGWQSGIYGIYLLASACLVSNYTSFIFPFLFWPKRRDWTKKNLVLALGSLRNPCSLNNTQNCRDRFFAAKLRKDLSEGKGLRILFITEKQIEINYHLPSTSILSQIQSFDRFIIESRWMLLIVVVGWTTQ